MSEIGGKFDVFLNTPTPDGDAWDIEHLRPEAADLAAVPAYLIEKTMEHTGAESAEGLLGREERDLIPDMLEDHSVCGPTHADAICFMVAAGYDVYANITELGPWSVLGNLKSHGVESVVRAFERDSVPGLRARFDVPVAELAAAFGRLDGRTLNTEGDLKSRLVRQWAMREVSAER